MTDIWEDKPDKGKWATFKHPVKSGEVLNALVYDSAEMDAWLEDLKAEYEAMIAQINLLKIDVEALDKENRILQNIGETPT